LAIIFVLSSVDKRLEILNSKAENGHRVSPRPLADSYLLVLNTHAHKPAPIVQLSGHQPKVHDSRPLSRELGKGPLAVCLLNPTTLPSEVWVGLGNQTYEGIAVTLTSQRTHLQQLFCR